MLTGLFAYGKFTYFGDVNASRLTMRFRKAVRTSDPARDDFNSDNFSAPDRRYFNDRSSQRPGYVGYLGTPSGTFRRYDTSDKSDKLF